MLIQLFNPELCREAKCKYLRFDACFNLPEECEKNKKWGYPKVIQNDKQTC